MGKTYRKQDLVPAQVMMRDGARSSMCGLRLEAEGGVTATNGQALIHVNPPSRGRDAEKREPAFIPAADLDVIRAQLKRGPAEIAGEPEEAPGRYRFPDWERLRPEGEPKASISFDARLMGKVLKAAAEYLESDPYRTITLEIRDEFGPIVLKGERPEDGQFYALVMPCRK